MRSSPVLGSSTLAVLMAVSCSGKCGMSKSPPTSSSDAGMDAGAPFQAGSPWPKFRHDMAQTGLGTVHASAQGGVQWSFATGAGIFSSPVVGADGTIYFGSADQSFYALNPDGSLKWKIQTGDIIDSAGLLDDQGNIYFGSGDGLLRAAHAMLIGQLLERLPEGEPLVRHHEIENIALGVAAITFVKLMVGVDGERGHLLVMKRAQAGVAIAEAPQPDVVGDDAYDVDLGFELLGEIHPAGFATIIAWTIRIYIL